MSTLAIHASGQWRQTARALLRSPKTVAGGVIVLALVLVAIFAPWIAPNDPLSQDLLSPLLPPAWMADGMAQYPLGTDSLGRCILSRLIFGSRVALWVGLCSAVGTMLLGCALALLAPRFPRLKEWAYAGAVFDYTGAAASHILASHGHRGAAWITPFLFAVFTFASWWLRPAERRLTQPAASQSPLRVVSWALPVLISATLLVFAALTLPKAMPHS